MSDDMGDPEIDGRRDPSSPSSGSHGVERASAQLASTLNDGGRPGGSRGARSTWIRFGLAAGVILIGIVVAAALRQTNEVPAPSAGKRVAFVDVEGWYRRTPDEAAVLTPFDLTLDALPASLPLELGPWRGVDRTHDPAVDRWLRTPEVSIERTYVRDDGAVVWLSAFGSRGRKSFRLFEHTPDTCYPLGGWSIEALSRARLPRGPLPLTVNQGVASGGAGRLVFLYFYVWDTPARDSDRGVLSVRLSAPVRSDDEATMAMLADDFLAEIFPATLDWVRF